MVLIAVMWIPHFFITNSDSPIEITCQQGKIRIFLCRFIGQVSSDNENYNHFNLLRIFLAGLRRLVKVI